MSLVVVGSVAIDNIITPEGRKDDALGGSATYFSCAASYFTDVALVGVIGQDFPKEHIEFFKAKNINLDGLKIEQGNTFRWTGEYCEDHSAATTLSLDLNVFENFSPELPDNYKDMEYVFLANIDPCLQMQVMRQVKKPKLVTMDTMNHWIADKKDDLCKAIKEVDIFVLNEDEARMISGMQNLINAADKLLDMGPSQVVVKKGAHGAFLMSKKDFFCLPAYPVKHVVDTTGAGDSFAGGFMGYLSRTNDLSDENLRRAVAYGIVMSSFTVEDFSMGRIGYITTTEIEKRFKELEEATRF